MTAGRGAARLALGAATAAAVGFAWWMGWLEREALRALFTESGAFGPLLFVLLFTGVQPFGVPGVLFIGLSATLWPPLEAFLLSYLGAVGAGSFGAAYARFVARDWVAARLPARLRDVEARVAARPLASVVVIRMTTYLFAPAHGALGLTSIRFPTLVLATAIGFLPPTALWTFAASGLLAWIVEQPPWLWWALGGLAAAAALGLLAWTRSREAGGPLRRRTLEQREP